MEVGVFIAYFFAGNEIVPILIERHEWCHVVFTVVANWCIGCGIVRPFWLVPSQPLLIDAMETKANSNKSSKQILSQEVFNFTWFLTYQRRHDGGGKLGHWLSPVLRTWFHSWRHAGLHACWVCCCSQGLCEDFQNLYRKKS